MQVTPSVRAVQVPESNPMHPQFTTLYLIGRGQVLTIDSGADEERYRWMLRGYLAATEKAEIAQCTITHFHSDHSSNVRWLCDEFEARALLAPETAERMPERHLPTSPASPVIDGESIDAGSGIRLQALHTPGHSPESFCFYLEDEGVLFTGDTILGGTTTAVTDLAAYMQSVERLQKLPNLRIICPGHGPLIYDPTALIAEYIAHRQAREQQIIDTLSRAGAVTSWQIMEALYSDIDPRLRRLADGNVRSHLDKLQHEGRVAVYAGTPRVRTENEVAEARSEEQRRQAVMQQAEEYRLAAQRRAIFLQENPPAQDWLEPPRYELT